MGKETSGVRNERGWNVDMEIRKKWKGRNGDGMEKKRGRWNGKRGGRMVKEGGTAWRRKEGEGEGEGVEWKRWE